MWHVRNSIVAKIDSIYWDYVLGTLTQVKKIGYYSGLDTAHYQLWFYDDYYAAGFGFFLEIGDA